MTYKEAFDWIEAHKNLIGTKTDKDMLICDLVAVPVNEVQRNAFLRTYVLTRNKVTSVIPFVKSNFEVWAIDTYLLETRNVFLYKKLV